MNNFKNKSALLLILVMSFFMKIDAQNNNVGIGTNTPDASSILELSATDKGLLITRVALNDASTAAPITSPVEGLLIYNATGSEAHGFWYWDGTEWLQVGSGSSGGGTLDDAYNFGGNGLGRAIAADYGSVEISLSNTTNGTSALDVISTTGTSGTPSLAIIAQNSGVGGSIYSENTNTANAYNSIEGSTNSTNAYTSAVAGYYDGTGQGVGVYGSVYDPASTGVAGVMGVNNRTSGGHGVFGQGVNGVVGETNDAGGAGLWGQNNDGTGTGNACGVIGDGNYGIWGQTSYGQAGVFGINTRVTGGHGVWGQGVNGVVGESVDVNGYGVFGQNSAAIDPGAGVAGLGITGVIGQSTNLSLSYGLFSYDDCGITQHIDIGGNLSVGGTKSFVIDHPNDPDNKFLKHFCIESPEVLNVYRGVTILNASGEAIVELPDYFTDINTNFSYSLTPVGSSAPNLYIKEKINNGNFVVAGGSANQEINWVVYAERNDKYMQANPDSKEVEVTKTGRYKGKYMHPELYGKTRDNSIFPNVNLKLTSKKNTIINNESIKLKDVKQTRNNK